MPSQVVIENPVINPPFAEPKRHFRFDEDGITDPIVKDRRVSCYFIPIAQPRKKGPKRHVEALETLIYIAEVARKVGDTWIENDLRRFNEDAKGDNRAACMSGSNTATVCIPRITSASKRSRRRAALNFSALKRGTRSL